MKTAKQMTRKLVFVAPHDSLEKARDLMDSGNFRHLPVIANDKLVGILSHSDIGWNHPPDATVAQSMTPHPVIVTPTTTVEEAARLMLDHKISAVPVVADGKPVGILSISDIVEALLEIERSETIAGLLGRTIGHGHMEF